MIGPRVRLRGGWLETPAIGDAALSLGEQAAVKVPRLLGRFEAEAHAV